MDRRCGSALSWRRQLLLWLGLGMLALVFGCGGGGGGSGGSASTDVLEVAVEGAGSVVSRPAGIDCGSDCSHAYDSGEQVTLSAKAQSGARFVGWSGACAGRGDCEVPMTKARSVTATFETAPATATLTLDVSRGGTVLAGSGKDCSADRCSYTVGSGKTITLVAKPQQGYRVASWGGACAASEDDRCVLVLDDSVQASVRFATPRPGVAVALQGDGSVVATDGSVDCAADCTWLFDSARALTLQAVPAAGFRFDGWSGAGCSGSGNCRVSASTQLPRVVARFVEIQPTACVPSGLGQDYQVGPGAGRLASLDQVPWERLAAGDTVRIHYRSEPYRGKVLLPAQGTAEAPVRLCGVKGPKGQRPVIDADGAVARRGLDYSAAELDNIQERRALVLVDRLASQDWATAVPSHVQIDGLELRGARPGHRFTNSLGKTQEYDEFGACIWVQRVRNLTIADNVIHDCTNGVFSQSSDDGASTITRNLRLAGNAIYGNGVAGSELQHNVYLQSDGAVYEFNRVGPLRSGARGNAIKDRSAGTVVRYNRIEEGAHSLDLVEAEDWAGTATASPAYRATYVYGNQIVKDGSSGSVIHYGGDHYGCCEANYRKGTLYFWNNTVLVTGTEGRLFQISTTEERAQVWNNILAFEASVQYPSLRQSSEIGAGYTPGGLLDLGVNWISAGWADSDPYHPVPGRITGTSKMLTGSALPIDPTSLRPRAGSAVLDAAQADPASVSAYGLDFQLDADYAKEPRQVIGRGRDLGANER